MGNHNSNRKTPSAKRDNYDPDPIVGMAEIMHEAGRQQEARRIEKEAKDTVALEQAIARERQRAGMVGQGGVPPNIDPIVIKAEKNKGGAPRKIDPAAVEAEKERRRAAGEPISQKALARHFRVHCATIGRAQKK
jgi:hypothetical protein